MAEVVEHLAVIGGWETTVLTPHEGPLRDRLERAGATVRLVDAVPFDDPVAYRAAVEKLAATFRHDVDLVVGPTVTSFPAVHAAALAGVPSVLRVGEAAPLPTIVAWMGSHLDGAVEEEARRSFAAASVVWSNSYRAVEIFQEHEYAARYVVQGSGIRAPRPDLLDQRAARARLGLPERRRIAICAATIWPMKGQGILVEAIRVLRAEHPQLLVVMVGIGDSSYTDLLRDYVAIHRLEDQVRIAPFQDDLTDWWRAADLVVCAAEQEALPGAVAEGMAHGLPVAATRVGDIPLILEEGRSGWLCDADDVAALVDALGRAAQATPETLRAYGRHAAAYIAREHNRADALDRTVALLEAAAGGVFRD
jgi:glycosyltransferase involved in cell wall biosynthesis